MIEMNEKNANAMFEMLHSFHMLVLEREPHIKAYKKARKLHAEILGNMIAYYQSGQFKLKIDAAAYQMYGGNSKNKKKNIRMNADFDLETNTGEQAFVEFVVYKHAPALNCITENFIIKNRYKKPEKLEFLQSMLDSSVGLFKVTGVEIDEAYVFLEEVFTGAGYKITDIALSESQNYEKNYIYTRIITYRGMSFSTGLSIVFDKNDNFIKDFIVREKNDYKPFGELARFIELYNQYKSDPNSVKVMKNTMI